MNNISGIFNKLTSGVDDTVKLIKEACEGITPNETNLSGTAFDKSALPEKTTQDNGIFDGNIWDEKQSDLEENTLFTLDIGLEKYTDTPEIDNIFTFLCIDTETNNTKIEADAIKEDKLAELENDTKKVNTSYYGLDPIGFGSDIIGGIIDGIGKIIGKPDDAESTGTDGTTSKKSDDPNKDEKIGETKQGQTGDCWLLSGVNALSYTEEGEKAIDEAIDWQDNGSCKVYLKGMGDDYYVEISKKEIDTVRQNQANEDARYSTDDDDMLVIELAIEKVLDKLANADFKFSDNAPKGFDTPEEAAETKKKNGTSLNNNPPALIFYLITGKSSESYTERKDKEQALEEFNGKNIALTAYMLESTDVTAINEEGEEYTVHLPGSHLYSIKSVDNENNTVTVINPHDSSKTITLSKDVFLSTFRSVCKLDLNGESVNYVDHLDEIGKDNSRTYYHKDPSGTSTYETYDKNGNIIERGELDAHNKKTPTHYYSYDGNNNKIEEGKVDESGNKIPTYRRIYDQNNRVTEETKLDKDGNTIAKHYFSYNEKGNIISKQISDADGKMKKAYYYSYDANDNMIEEKELDENGNIDSIHQYKYDENGNVLEETGFDKDGIKTYETYYEYDKNGKLICTTIYEDLKTPQTYSNALGEEFELVRVYTKRYANGTEEEGRYDQDGNLRNVYHTDKDGNRTTDDYYLRNGTLRLTTIYGAENEVDRFEFMEYDNSGHIKKVVALSEQEINQMRSRNLIGYSQFGVDELCSLTRLSNEKWEIAEKVLTENPNASYEEIMNEVNKTENDDNTPKTDDDSGNKKKDGGGKSGGGGGNRPVEK